MKRFRLILVEEQLADNFEPVTMRILKKNFILDKGFEELALKDITRELVETYQSEYIYNDKGFFPISYFKKNSNKQKEYLND